MSDQISTFTPGPSSCSINHSQGSLRTVTTVSAAVVQAAPVAFDVEATLEKVERLTAEAAAADLVVFPEAFVSAYPRGIGFGAVVGSRTDEGRAWFRRYWESSIDVPGPAVERLGRDRARARRPPRDRRDRARRRDAVLHRAVPLPRRRAARQAPQADADGRRAARVGHRRRLHDAGARHAAGPARRGHLLGELHAADADGHVREGDPALLRADRRRARDVGGEHAPHRLRGPLLRAVGEPVRPPRRLPGGLPDRGATTRRRCSATAAR